MAAIMAITVRIRRLAPQLAGLLVAVAALHHGEVAAIQVFADPQAPVQRGKGPPTPRTAPRQSEGERLQPRDLGPTPRRRLGRCDVRFPGSEDRDAGLAQTYLREQTGRSYVFVPFVSAREIYTDNVELAPEGEEEEAFVTALIPGFSACATGRRFHGQINYQAEGYYYSDDQDRNEIFHDLAAQGRGELISRRVFIDAFVRNEQRLVDAERPFSDDNALDTGNRTDALTYGVSPWVRQDLGTVGIATLRYQHRRTEYGDVNVRGRDEEEIRVQRTPDTYSNTYEAQIASKPNRPTWSWLVQAREERLKEQGGNRQRRDDRDDTEYFGQASAQVGYRINGRLTLLGRGGLEHDYNADGTTDRFGSPFWDVGARWEGPRTRAEARVGERFFGTSYEASVTRFSPRLTSTLSYRETPETESRLDLNRSQFDDPSAPSIPDSEVPDNTRPSLFGDRLFVDKRFSASSTYRTGRSRISFDAYYSDREAIRTGLTEELYGTELAWRWEVLPRTTLTPSWSWQRREFEDGDLEYTRRYQISAARLISTSVQAGITLRRQDQDATERENSYTENAVILEITKAF